jgi:hypothetical protein
MKHEQKVKAFLRRHKQVVALPILNEDGVQVGRALVALDHMYWLNGLNMMCITDQASDQDEKGNNPAPGIRQRPIPMESPTSAEAIPEGSEPGR